MRAMHPDKMPDRPSDKARRRSLIVATALVTMVVTSAVVGLEDSAPNSRSTLRGSQAERDRKAMEIFHEADQGRTSKRLGDHGDIMMCQLTIFEWVDFILVDPVTRQPEVDRWFGWDSPEATAINAATLEFLAEGHRVTPRLRQDIDEWCQSYLTQRRPAGTLPPLVGQNPCLYLSADPACLDNPLALEVNTCLQGRVLALAPHCDPGLNSGI